MEIGRMIWREWNGKETMILGDWRFIYLSEEETPSSCEVSAYKTKACAD